MPRIASFGAMSAMSYGFNRVSLGGPYFMALFATNNNAGFPVLNSANIFQKSNGDMAISAYAGYSGGTTASAFTLSGAMVAGTVHSVSVSGVDIGLYTACMDSSDNIHVMQGNGDIGVKYSSTAATATAYRLGNMSSYTAYYDLASSTVYFGGVNFGSCCTPNTIAVGGVPSSNISASTSLYLSSTLIPADFHVVLGPDPTAGQITLSYQQNGQINFLRVTPGSGTASWVTSGGGYFLTTTGVSGYNVPRKLVMKGGYLYMAGSVGDGSNVSGLLLQMTTSGSNWQIVGAIEAYRAIAGDSIIFNSVTTDSAGNIYVIGDNNGQQTRSVIHVIKFDPTTLNAIWSRQITITGGLTPTTSANDILVDSSGNLWIVGQYKDGNSYSYGLVMKVPRDGSKTGSHAFSTPSGTLTVNYAAATSLAPTIKAPPTWTSGSVSTQVGSNSNSRLTSLTPTSQTASLSIATSTLL